MDVSSRGLQLGHVYARADMAFGANCSTRTAQPDTSIARSFTPKVAIMAPGTICRFVRFHVSTKYVDGVAHIMRYGAMPALCDETESHLEGDPHRKVRDSRVRALVYRSYAQLPARLIGTQDARWVIATETNARCLAEDQQPTLFRLPQKAEVSSQHEACALGYNYRSRRRRQYIQTGLTRPL